MTKCFNVNELQKPPTPMKPFVTILLVMFATVASAQVYNNEPKIVNPIISEWMEQAIANGVDTSKMSSLKFITFVDNIPGIAGADYWRGEIRISREKIWRDVDGSIFLDDIKWKIYHEISHHYGVDDCFQCRYNIFSGNSSARALYLYRDDIIKRLIDDQYFERIKDPDGPHTKHF